ncbi:hypothetical protein [Streptomyces sp. ST2-7A]|uniref:hypothetical protein n=1 Tax=Streptomyces sp. ST2-7A TaxID=2907214 RepID=UPI001F468017|nr:hypothetical protein [Streptomyces sp. ST2-7A]MCE7079845.1 hypothetical protein [Streptomyces sp. ST2-7A]
MRQTTMAVLGTAASGVVLLLGAASCSSGDGNAVSPPRLPDGDIEAWATMMSAIHGIEWEREGEPAGDDGSEHLVREGSATVGYDPADHVPEGGAAGEEAS